jgi:hypothetical protein
VGELWNCSSTLKGEAKGERKEVGGGSFKKELYPQSIFQSSQSCLSSLRNRSLRLFAPPGRRLMPHKQVVLVPPMHLKRPTPSQVSLLMKTPIYLAAIVLNPVTKLSYFRSKQTPSQAAKSMKQVQQLWESYYRLDPEI